MAVNLITKHGLMPKKCFPETFSCESSSRLNNILKSKLREYARTLRLAIEQGESDAKIQLTISSMMSEIYRIVGICLGIPPAKFTWEYTDKSKQFQSVGPHSPQEFYETFVKPVWSVEEKVCLVSDPRPTNPFGRTYSVDCLGNMVGGRRVLYNNQPVEVLMDLARDSILANESVWFGCEVSKRWVNSLCFRGSRSRLNSGHSRCRLRKSQMSAFKRFQSCYLLAHQGVECRLMLWYFVPCII